MRRWRKAINKRFIEWYLGYNRKSNARMFLEGWAGGKSMISRFHIQYMQSCSLNDDPTNPAIHS
jgi:hypothetical protein